MGLIRLMNRPHNLSDLTTGRPQAAAEGDTTVVRRKLRVLAVGLAALLLAACSGPGNGANPPGGGPPDGAPRGLLVAAGTGYIHTYDLDGGNAWSQRRRYSAPWSTVSVVAADNELLIASTSGAEPVAVEVFDIATFGLKETITWPNSTAISNVHSLAATRDGEYLALVMDTLGLNPFLEIIERQTGDVVYTGLQVATLEGMAWTADDRLVVPVDLSQDNNEDHWGSIVMFALADFAASTDGNVDGTIVTTFTQTEWDLYGPGGLALSPDDSELVFERVGDLWVVDLEPGATPHQLTTGPPANYGAVFSPTGSHLAFASGGSLGLDETYIIPNHREAPLFIDHGQRAGDQYLLEANTMVDFSLAWLP